MPEFTHQEDKSPTNPQVSVGLDALAKMLPAQADAVILRVVEKLMENVQRLDNRVKYLEKYETNPQPPVREVVGDSEFIKVSRNEEHVQVSLDEEELRRHFPPPMFPTYLDKYRHCTDPAANADILLPSGIADTNLNANGELVLRVGFADGAEKCYYIIERNVLGAPTTYSNVTKVDDCDSCTDVPPPPTDPPTDPPPDGDYPYFTGWVVTDFACRLLATGALAIDVSYVNIQTGETKIETKLNCCCDTTAPYDPPGTVVMDRWRPCNAGDYSGDDIFLPTAVYDFYELDDPIIQIDNTGTCYQFVEETADETLTTGDIWIKETCEDETCEEYNPPIQTLCDDCQAATNVPSQTFTSTGDCSGLTNNIKDPRTYTFTSVTLGGANPVVWQFNAGPATDWGLFIYCDSVGDIWALASYSPSLAYFGDGGGGSGSYRKVTGEVTCSNGQFSGSFKLYRNGLCTALDLSYVEITF